MKKRKIRIAMAGIFCAGVLMGGIGTGITFAEFSSFAYQPVTVPEEAFQTKVFTYQMEEDETIWIRRYIGGKLCTIEKGEDVPEGIVEIHIVYNEQTCSLEMTDYLDNENMPHLYIYLDSGGDVEHFMRYKDAFLEGLRQKVLRDYQMEYVRDVEIRVNPKDRERVKFE